MFSLVFLVGIVVILVLSIAVFLLSSIRILAKFLHRKKCKIANMTGMLSLLKCLLIAILNAIVI